MTLVKRRIDATITLGTGQFGDTVGDTVTLTGLRIMAAINSVGGEAQGQAAIRIFGLPLTIMNKLTSVGPFMNQIRMKNKILIAAGDEGGALTTVFRGVIDTAYAELNSAPSVALSIVAFSALEAAIMPVGSKSFTGAQDVAFLMQQFASTIAKSTGEPFPFNNHGVSVKISNPSFNGTALDWIRELAAAAHINHRFDHPGLTIWPEDAHTTEDVIPLSPQTGLVGYPALNSQYIALKSIFIPNAHLGQRVAVSGSEIVGINGTWTIFTVTHNLESQTPGGQWFTELQVFTNGV
jgi:hypothetical protein